MGAADVHLLVLDIEKLKAKEAAREPLSLVPDITPHVSSTGAPAPRTSTKPPSRAAGIVSKGGSPAKAPDVPADFVSTWNEGKKCLSNGDTFQALQKFLSAKRLFNKGQRDPADLARLEHDIASAKQVLNQPTSTSRGNFTSRDDDGAAPASCAASNGTVPVQAPFSGDMATTFQNALDAKAQGRYDEALAALSACLQGTAGNERHALEREVAKLQQLVSLKKQVDATASRGGFVRVGDDAYLPPDSPVSQQERDVKKGGAPGWLDATGMITEKGRPDPEELAKIEKRKEAEKLIVEAENEEHVPMAIEKLKDAAHLLLVTGTRRDRVEWVYEKINALKLRGGEQGASLFQIEKFDFRLLKNYAFMKIDQAIDKTRYGRFNDAVEFYKQAVKTLTRAGWSQQQVNYIIDDMIDARKKQDEVERELDALQDLVEGEIAFMLDKMDGWRRGTLDVGATSVAMSGASIDENVFRPGREKTLREKSLEKMALDQARRASLKQDMVDFLDNASHLVNLGRFQEAINEYNDSVEIMDQLGGWDSQKELVLKEIGNLHQLLQKQEEILSLHKSRSVTSAGKAADDERLFLIKQAAVLNQENLKERLLAKHLREDNEKAAFDILIPIANKLKAEGKVQEALVEFKEVIKLLSDGGWEGQLQSLKDEVSQLETKVEAQKAITSIETDRRAIREEVFVIVIPKARDAMARKEYKEAKRLYAYAIEKLKSIGWEEYIRPLLESLAEIDMLSKASEASEAQAARVDPRKDANDAIEMGMRFLSKDMKSYALQEFEKAMPLLEAAGDQETFEEIMRQVKKIELELKLQETDRMLREKKQG